MKRIGLSILTALLVVSLAATVWAQTPSQARGGISTPYIYKYDPATGDRSAYYLAVPTLIANDTLCGLTTSQTLTNKTLTAPVIVGELSTGDAITGDGSAALGGFLKTVTNDADAHTVTAAESGTVLTNAGNDGDPVGEFTLPSAAVGLNYCFIVMVNQELRVIPAAGDAINIAGVQGDAAEYWTANATGESLCIVAVDVNNWVATSYAGTWTQQTP